MFNNFSIESALSTYYIHFSCLLSGPVIDYTWLKKNVWYKSKPEPIFFFCFLYSFLVDLLNSGRVTPGTDDLSTLLLPKRLPDWIPGVRWFLPTKSSKIMQKTRAWPSEGRSFYTSVYKRGKYKYRNWFISIFLIEK